MNESQSLAFCKSMIVKIRAWRYDLPSELLTNRSDEAPPPPQVFTLHMVYYTSIILLFKPFIHHPSFNNFGANSGAFPGKDAANESAATICYEAAKQICVLGKKYRLEYGTFRKSPLTATHCTLSAALLILQKLKASRKMNSNSDLMYLKSCLAVMHELSPSWQPALQYWKNLSRIYDEISPSASGEAESNKTTKNMDHSDHLELTQFEWSDDLFLGVQSASLGAEHHFPGMMDSEFETVSDQQGHVINKPFVMSQEALQQDFGFDFMFDSLPADYANMYPLNMSHF